ncbi:hypothetical protein KYK30_11140 [Shinella yambaruensis]|uniref:Uncharacterized protein n=1 Tax=Shinella yambaruensis TaxID=415996 RepID=A0ABQ5ZCF7_9HYPH|nr:hypothetical protein [Shinella yambaruensis]MCJ8028266.1 hypothetical protein [Shinella yambaruensis]MCU7980252.1 hypothetical protein [Shinella yambaruensis]GLR49231.1 hypothetical protein GCM10007923_04360 [Shinella yambaruensis]
MTIDRTQAIAEYIAINAALPSVPTDLRADFLSKFPEPTTEELYAGYETAHDLTEGEATDRIDDVFDVIIGDEEAGRMQQVEDSLLPVPAKYYLSGKACANILARADHRGGTIPEPLRSVLEAQAGRAA